MDKGANINETKEHNQFERFILNEMHKDATLLNMLRSIKCTYFIFYRIYSSINYQICYNPTTNHPIR